MKNPTTPRRILIADDQPDVLEALRLLLKGEGYQIEAAASPRAAVAAIEARDFDVVLMDLNYTRDTKPMVTVNAGGLAETLFESELFGHVKGAFTDARTDRVGRFELADTGTLFMDEVANVPAIQTVV